MRANTTTPTLTAAMLILGALAGCTTPAQRAERAEQERFVSWARACRAAGALNPDQCAHAMMREQIARSEPSAPEQQRLESWAWTCKKAGALNPHDCARYMLAKEQARGTPRYNEQNAFDQWAASCKQAESYNPARCAATMYTIEKRNY